MLAPRKKLWSTPEEVILEAIRHLALTQDDVCYDIGAGDGRLLFQICDLCDCSVIGVEIDDERCKSIQQVIDDKSLSEKCQIINGNALDINYSEATAFFLYLIPRGMKVFYNHILSQLKNKNIKVVTYMSPLTDSVKPSAEIKIKCANHPEAEWPLYVYHLYNTD